MNTNQGIVRWLTSVLLIALLLQFARVTPSASAQGEETATPVLTDTPRIDVDQDGMYDDVPNESSLSGQQSFAPLSNELNLGSEPVSIGMVQAGAYTIPRDRLAALGFSVTLISPTSNLNVFQEYDVVYLPLAWTSNSGVYQTIESHANDYQLYVSGGGGLFVEQPNPCGYPGDEATPTLLPYPITFFCPYNPDDDPLIVDPNHFITMGLTSEEMPFPADQMTSLDPAYQVLVEGKITRSPSLVVADYGTGHVLVETAHPGYGAIKVFSDEVYRRMINWTASAITGCTTDTFEPDDSLSTGNPITLGEEQRHSLCPQGDEDWVNFQVPPNLPGRLNILVETFDLEPDDINPNSNTKLIRTYAE